MLCPSPGVAMATPIAPERFSSEGLPMLVMGVVAAAGVAYLLSLVAFPPEPAAILASGVAVLPPAIANAVFKRRRGRDAELVALSHGGIVRPVPLVIAMVAGVLLLTFQGLSFVTGVAVGVGMQAGPALTIEDQISLLSLATLLTTCPIFVLIAFFVAYRACHYLASRPYLWLLCAVALQAILQLALDTITLGPPTIEQLVFSLVFSGIVYGAMALGCWRGMRVHQQFVASRLLRRLQPADLRAVLELISETVMDRTATNKPAKDGV